MSFKCLDKSDWGCVHPDVVEWYRDKSIELKNKYGNYTGLAFLHIPTPEFMYGYNVFNIIILEIRI